MKKVFLDNLPKWESGNCKGRINWECSIGFKIKFIFNNIEGELEIIEYIKTNLKNNKVKVVYINKSYDIFTSDLGQCKISNILGIRTSDFKFKIGDILEDDKRNIMIINSIYVKDKNNQNRKYYKYKCNKCGFECGEHYYDGQFKKDLYIEEGNLKSGKGCACCSNQVTVEHINSIVANKETHWMIPYFQGGYDEAKQYTYRSSKYIQFICPYCKRIKDSKTIIYSLNKNGLSCICNDKKSYPEKVVYSILEQININFKIEKYFNWSKNIKHKDSKLCGDKRYDFYFEYENNKYIIEVHGGQHYKETNRKGARTLEQEQENDRLKEELALANEVKKENYIVIDCRYSDLEFIKKNILDKLGNLFDLSIIDWNECNRFACNNMVKIACDIYNSGIESTVDIGNVMHIEGQSILKYLKLGRELGWCNYKTQYEKYEMNKNKIINLWNVTNIKNAKTISHNYDIPYGTVLNVLNTYTNYDPNESMKISNSKKNRGNSKNVICLETNEEFSSCAECSRESLKKFGVYLQSAGISKVCIGIRKSYMGFHFKYVNKEMHI